MLLSDARELPSVARRFQRPSPFAIWCYTSFIFHEVYKTIFTSCALMSLQSVYWHSTRHSWRAGCRLHALHRQTATKISRFARSVPQTSIAGADRFYDHKQQETHLTQRDRATRYMSVEMMKSCLLHNGTVQKSHLNAWFYFFSSQGVAEIEYCKPIFLWNQQLAGL